MKRHWISSAANLLADGEKAKALKVAEEGVAIFEDHLTKELRDFLSRIYKDSDPKKYRDTLQSSFLQSGDWQYYVPLKKASKGEEWQERLGMILDHFSGSRFKDRYGGSKLVEIYLKEKMYDQALTVSYLKRMKSIEGYEEAVSEIVGRLRVEHKQKPAFIDEMKEL